MPLIQAVERALSILDLFSEQQTELKITEISRRTGLHKSTLHSLLKTMQIHGYVEQSEPNGPYRLGMKLFERGFLVLKSKDVVAVARPRLAALAGQTGQTTHLGILDGEYGVYVDKVEGERSIIAYSRIGRRMPLHSTAIGKILLAYRSRQELEAILDGYEFAAITENSISDRAALMRVLEGVRESGWAIDEQENVRGVRCAAVPIWNHEGKLVAAVSISTIVENVSRDEFASFIDPLRLTGKGISGDLGFATPR
jgi:IclR family transcriptional regulator, KDG regulon repressor